MTPDSGSHVEPEPDDARTIAVLRNAPWTLPIDQSLLDRVVREVDRRRRRRVVSAAVGAAAAVALVVGGVVVAAGWHSSESSTPAPATHRTATPTPSSTRERVTVGSYAFAVPTRWIVDPMSSSASARFGTDGLQNDGQPPGPTDMAVDLTARRISTPDRHSQVYITVITPLPTAAHPGPAPTPDPDAARTAVSSILRFGVGPHGAQSTTEVPGLRLGPATRYTTSGTTTVLIAPRSTDVVIELECVNTPNEVLLELLRSGAEG